jgi:hypothetical protein
MLNQSIPKFWNQQIVDVSTNLQGMLGAIFMKWWFGTKQYVTKENLKIGFN